MSSIVPNFKNPYKCREEDMKPLEDSIRENGIIQPLMVRKDDKADVYEIISGHRRYLAATRLKLTEVPVVVLDITKEEADIILVDSNLYREHTGKLGIVGIGKSVVLVQPRVEPPLNGCDFL